MNMPQKRHLGMDDMILLHCAKVRLQMRGAILSEIPMFETLGLFCLGSLKIGKTPVPDEPISIHPNLRSRRNLVWQCVKTLYPW